MNAPNEKPFKQLWRELSKAGLKARKPKGLSADFTYVMPSVTGRLDAEKRGVEYFVARIPMGKNAAFELARSRRAPVEEVMPAEGQAAPTLEVTPTPPTPPSSFPPRTSASPPSTQAGQAVQQDTEQEGGSTTTSLEDPEYDARSGHERADESKSESDNFNGIDKFDGENFMDALRGEKLFGSVVVDDVNLCGEAEDDNDSIGGVFDDELDVPVSPREDYESEVESDSDCEEASELFVQVDEDMRRLGTSGIEVYLGAANNPAAAKGTTQKAVIRNVNKALEGQPAKRLVVADNFYSSCALVLDLLRRGYYYVGTHRNDRLGWPVNFAFTQKTRLKRMPRGTYRVAQAKDFFPELIAVSWMDSNLCL
ncbi:hypothetical protein PInf_022882 [Phytophthora infestans]|nr:hypothetical protein PInf_022880 [Phytophthora infestans]KAI9989134.1 hypothetical protein PInf_022882 [Phytophthora infestans]